MPLSRRGKKRVFLTFDDGPVAQVTPWVLDTLDRYGVKATFFMVGDNVARNPQLLKRVRERGHNVGNHTMHHLNGARVATSQYLRDVEMCDELLESPLMRPPHGWLRPAQMRKLKERYKIIMFDVVTRDYNRRLTPEDVLENVKRFTRDGSIIVFHDSIKSKDRMMEALPKAIEWLQAEGYEFRLL